MAQDANKDGSLLESCLQTPMMQQYCAIKEEHPDCMLFFRMGDFYEMFLDDAITASRILDIQLTKRQNQIPMAGVPYHSYAGYVRKLLAVGLRVAIAEQEPDPRNAKLMIRRVRRILSPSTIVEEEFSDHEQHNYLMSLTLDSSRRLAVATADFATADFILYPFEKKFATDGQVTDVISRFFASFKPREILVSAKTLHNFEACHPFRTENPYPFVLLPDWQCKSKEGIRLLEAMYQMKPAFFLLEEKHPALATLAMILHYLRQHYPTHPELLSKPIRRTYFSDHINLDRETIAQLDLLQSYQETDKKSSRSLLAVVDQCVTHCGRRLLRERIVRPFKKSEAIQECLRRIEILKQRPDLRKKIRTCLKEGTDLEHIVNRLVIKNGRPQDFASIRNTLSAVKRLVATDANADADADTTQTRTQTQTQTQIQNMEDAAIDVQLPAPLQQLLHEISQTIVDQPGQQIEADTPMVKAGNCAQLDEARLAKNHSGSLIATFETAERKRTGIGKLRVRYNKILGYFIEISRALAEKSKLPSDYYLRQTLQHQQRYANEHLSKIEERIRVASEIILKREQEFFQILEEKVFAKREHIRKLMKQIAALDYVQGFAQTADQLNWSKPTFRENSLAPPLSHRSTSPKLDSNEESNEDSNEDSNEEWAVRIEAGRHPVIEHFLPADRQFIANDFFLKKEERLVILSGPNMAGKSTYIRQIAIIQLLAQMGSYVPAKAALLPLVDQIFTRIGAHDNLTRGESTFFVEMQESARILTHATKDSLIVMDEIGRGTSTQDGYALAASILEFIVQNIGAITLFSTHFHALTSTMPNLLQDKKNKKTEKYGRFPVVNMTLEVKEDPQQGFFFTHKAIRGASDQSHGIHVAQMAGLPKQIIDRAKQKIDEPSLFE